ncbi:MAG: DegT/DnrJ/EryC1/StrS family aminotransferase [Anaerolineae bacterium]|nr:DegT/DnrJ/EryC1/StrS family aminotransferase [Anaerolineae bacterium]
MKVPFVDLQAQHQPLMPEIMQAVQNVLTKGNFILGNEVNELEQMFADYCGVKYAIGMDNGLAAEVLALEAYGVGPGDEVITQANTFIATAAAATMVGAKVVLVDCDPDTYQIDLDQLEAAITPRTKAIMPVHLYGIPADMDRIMAIANKHNLLVIEDACQAHGAFYKGKRVGSFGHAAAFSFYPAKNLGAAGDGGIVVTNDAQIAEKLKILRNCGSPKKYYHTMTPHNHRLDTLHAAILKIKLPHLDDWNVTRRARAAEYEKLFAGTPIITPKYQAETEPVWHLYVVRVENRTELQDYLSKQGIGTGIHYPIPIHLQPFYENLGYKQGAFPVTESYMDKILSLPMFEHMTAEQAAFVAEQTIKFASEAVTA